jgi:hypothetical protein
MDGGPVDRLTRGVSGRRARRGALGAGLAATLVGWRGATHAAPSEETFNVITVDDAFVDAFWTDTCGVTARQRVDGVIKQAGTQDADGHLVPRLEVYRLTHVLTGPGGRLNWHDRGSTGEFVVNPDGTITVASAGPILRLTVPGTGTVAADIGRRRVVVTVDAAGNIVDEQVLWKAGPNPDEAAAADLAAVCAWLAG